MYLFINYFIHLANQTINKVENNFVRFIKCKNCSQQTVQKRSDIEKPNE